MSKPIGYIICESNLMDEPKAQIVREDTIEVPDKESGELKKHRRVVAQTILQTAQVKNRNNRIYPKSELFPQLESERTTQLITHGQMKGEAGHPLDTSLVRQQTIDEKLTSVRYLKFWTEGNYIWGEYKGTNNSYGETLDLDLREGCIPEFSLRALGSVESTPQGAVVSNLKMITYDQVIFQSDYAAYTRKIVSESAGQKEILVPDRKDILYPVLNEDVKKYIIAESANIKMIKESFDIFYDTINLSEDGSRVLMLSKNGDFMSITLEKYIANEIYDYAKRNK